jgi:hypothetical protein
MVDFVYVWHEKTIDYIARNVADPQEGLGKMWELYNDYIPLRTPRDKFDIMEHKRWEMIYDKITGLYRK